MTKSTTFADPAEAKLRKTMSAATAKVTGSVRKTNEPPAPLTGNLEEAESLSMNEKLTDAEIAFDEIYLPYPRHTKMQIAMDRVRLHGAKANGMPMRGLRVTGPTGSGKTTGIEEYISFLMRSGRFEAGMVPVLYVRLHKKTTLTKVLRAIVGKFGDRHASSRKDDELYEQVRNCLTRAGVQLIVLDECQHLKNLSNDSMQVTDQFKVFLDESIVPVVFSGTYDADPMFDTNRELCGRLAETVDLKPLNPEDVDDVALFTEFMRRLDEKMVERKLVTEPSGLNDSYQVTCLMLASKGVIGMAYRIVRAALLIAIAREADHVEAYDLALAVNRWAIPNKVCKANPFLRVDLRAAA